MFAIYVLVTTTWIKVIFKAFEAKNIYKEKFVGVTFGHKCNKMFLTCPTLLFLLSASDYMHNIQQLVKL